ncbi:MAG: hypothetical protein F6K36_23585 [Symploca sp. SIO3C6]|uniref:YtxH domain-containing protein n=1 Tax=Symploca sp. SIO1C4 TaxID=2607765 RepID=A0A6B3NCX0_9CYAN|nr:hypothetical protein [Symploca sp. SIO3C6]NER26998.1 hypothetical protein [Symploca sp. SIO1C4]NET06385.1 hypothetical protein [Symploca sp. SIO2B6]NET51750.1 hypothetical protein [Merismopedia sp. SIO2A8]
MSERDGFTGGFLTGAVVGGLVGGVIGALVSSAGRESEQQEQEGSWFNSSLAKAKVVRDRRSQLQAQESIEAARRSLEDKIAQLNTAIDDVRQQLGKVNGNGLEVETNRERILDP